jgi:hypothetical protein
MFDQLSAEIRASLIKGFPTTRTTTTTTTTTTKQNVDPAVYSRVKKVKQDLPKSHNFTFLAKNPWEIGWEIRGKIGDFLLFGASLLIIGFKNVCARRLL